MLRGAAQVHRVDQLCEDQSGPDEAERHRIPLDQLDHETDKAEIAVDAALAEGFAALVEVEAGVERLDQLARRGRRCEQQLGARPRRVRTKVGRRRVDERELEVSGAPLVLGGRQAIGGVRRRRRRHLCDDRGAAAKVAIDFAAARVPAVHAARAEVDPGMGDVGELDGAAARLVCAAHDALSDGGRLLQQPLQRIVDVPRGVPEESVESVALSIPIRQKEGARRWEGVGQRRKGR